MNQLGGKKQVYKWQYLERNSQAAICQLLPTLKSSSLDAFEPPWTVLQILERTWFLGLGFFRCVFGFGFSGKEMNILEEPNIIPIHYWHPKLNSIQLF